MPTGARSNTRTAPRHRCTHSRPARNATRSSRCPITFSPGTVDPSPGRPEGLHDDVGYTEYSAGLSACMLMSVTDPIQRINELRDAIRHHEERYYTYS